MKGLAAGLPLLSAGTSQYPDRRSQMTRKKRLGSRLIAFRALRGDAGQEIVEMAFVLSILLLVLIAIISFGRAYNIYQTVTRAAREGARMAVLTNCATCGNAYYTASQIQTYYVNPALQAANLDPTNPTYTQSYRSKYVWLDQSGSPPQQCGIDITFAYPYQLDLPFTNLTVTTLTLKTGVQMRMENQTGTCP